MKHLLDTVTLLGADCVNIERLSLAVDICQESFEFADVKLLSSLPAPKGVATVEIPHISSTEEYSHFVIEHLDEYVQTPHVLVVQYDGFILNKDAWDDTYLNYDYIGAPWLVRKSSVNRFGFPESLLGTRVVGNGGFSLRSKKFLETTARMAQSDVFTDYHPEDVQLCVHHRSALEDAGLQFAPVELAQQFSFESDGETDRWNGQFGFHGIRWTDISQWIAKHPDYVVSQQNNTLLRYKGTESAGENKKR